MEEISTKTPNPFYLMTGFRYSFVECRRPLDSPKEIADMGWRIYTRNDVILGHKFEAKN